MGFFQTQGCNSKVLFCKRNVGIVLTVRILSPPESVPCLPTVRQCYLPTHPTPRGTRQRGPDRSPWVLRVPRQPSLPHEQVLYLDARGLVAPVGYVFVLPVRIRVRSHIRWSTLCNIFKSIRFGGKKNRSIKIKHDFSGL